MISLQKRAGHNPNYNMVGKIAMLYACWLNYPLYRWLIDVIWGMASVKSVNMMVLFRPNIYT